MPGSLDHTGARPPAPARAGRVGLGLALVAPAALALMWLLQPG